MTALHSKCVSGALICSSTERSISRLVSFDGQMHLLIERTRQVAHHPRKALQHRGDRHRPRAQDGLFHPVKQLRFVTIIRLHFAPHTAHVGEQSVQRMAGECRESVVVRRLRETAVGGVLAPCHGT